MRFKRGNQLAKGQYGPRGCHSPTEFKSGWLNPMKGKHHPVEIRDRQSRSFTEHEKTVREEAVALEKDGFRVLRADRKPKPDLIAMKDGKIYAVEVQFGRYADYGKYNGTTFFDDVIWIRRDRRRENDHRRLN